MHPVLLNHQFLLSFLPPPPPPPKKKKDEALARRLQKEEDSKAGRHHQKKHHKFRHLTEPSSLAVMATEKYRAHHNSSPPQLKGTLSSSPQTGGGLTDIMGEQMAQQVQEAEVVRNACLKFVIFYDATFLI